MRFIALFAVLSCALVAQDTEPVYRVGNGVSPPGIIRKVDPQYSEEAAKAGLVGKVLLQVVVGTDGKPRDAKVIRSLGLGLDENALAAVGAWEFAPGNKDGQPVNVRVWIEVNFGQLEKDTKDRWHVTRVAFHLVDGSIRPVLENTVAPLVVNGASGADALVKFDIDAKGEPVNFQIEKSSDQAWSREVTAALSKWKFTPGSQNGSPVSVSCSMDFVRSD
jgi:TonB family protein